MKQMRLGGWRVVFAMALVSGFLAQTVWLGAQTWTEIVPGIEYRQYNLTSPRVNKVFVTRMDRATTSVIIDASLANGKITQPGVAWNTETVPNQVARYDGAFGYWGRTTARYRYKVVAAINGNGYSMANGCPDSPMAIGGALVKRTDSTGGEAGIGMGFLYKLGSATPTPGTPYLGGNLSLPADGTKNRISFTDLSYLQFHKLNDLPTNNTITIYTHHFGAATPATTNVTEVVVKNQDSAPLRVLPWSNKVTGEAVERKLSSSGGTPIPFDGYVIVASGDMRDDVEGKVPSVGTAVFISQETRDQNPGTWTPWTTVDWTNMYCAIGPMWGNILYDSKLHTSTGTSYTSDIHPRTGVAFNAQYIYFVVIDGRAPGVSEGMTLSEMATWCMSELGATHAVNNDGGGSSTMWVDGLVKNTPSDGSPRQVANGLMMIQLLPKEASATFAPSQTVYTNTPSSTLSLRTGPGTHFHVIQSISHGSALTILAHELNGLRAQNVGANPGYWWKVETGGGVEGWVSETYLSASAGVDGWTNY